MATTSSPSADDLDRQRPINSEYLRLYDLSQLVRDQRREIQGLVNRISSREAAFLSSRRSRPGYVSDDDLADLSGLLDLNAVKELLQKRDKMLAAKLGQLRNGTMEYTLDKSTAYLRLRRLGDDADSVARRWMSLLCLSIFVVVIVLSLPWQRWFGRHDGLEDM